MAIGSSGCPRPRAPCQSRCPKFGTPSSPFESRLLTFLTGHRDVLQRLVTEMYARGLSTRDIEDAFTDATGVR